MRRHATRASIVNLGSELTKGETVNTNASYIAGQLTRRGIRVAAVVSVPDEYELAREYARLELGRDGICIFTGGLGGTRDDITRRVVGAALDVGLVVDRERAELLRSRYRRKKRDFREEDLMQAAFPEGGRLLDNTVGLAYGFYLKQGDRHIFSIPGVPREMTAMLDGQVLPILEREGLFNPGYRSELLSFSNIPEYTLDRLVAGVVEAYPGIEYGTRAGYGVIKVRVETGAGAQDALSDCVRELAENLDEHLIGVGDRPLSQVVGEELGRRGLTLGTAESCTGGWLGKVLTDIPGSSGYYRGGIVAYSNVLKERLLGVSSRTLREHGAVSRSTAAGMASGARRVLETNLALSITGIAGPEGGTEEKPVGTVYVGLCGERGEAMTHHLQYGSDRETIRLFSVNRALFMLLRFLRGGTVE